MLSITLLLLTLLTDLHTLCCAAWHTLSSIRIISLNWLKSMMNFGKYLFHFLVMCSCQCWENLTFSGSFCYYFLFLIYLSSCLSSKWFTYRSLKDAAGSWGCCVTEDGSILAQTVKMKSNYTFLLSVTQVPTALLFFNVSTDQILYNALIKHTNNVDFDSF